MLVKNYSTNVSENSHHCDNLVVHLRSEINKVFDLIGASGPEFTSNADMFFDKKDSLHLNVTETDDVVMIEAELSGFRPVDVDVSVQHQSIVIEACGSDVQNKSYYLGEHSQSSCRWIIPLGCEIEKDSLRKKLLDETLIVSVSKTHEVTRLVAVESEKRADCLTV